MHLPNFFSKFRSHHDKKEPSDTAPPPPAMPSKVRARSQCGHSEQHLTTASSPLSTLSASLFGPPCLSWQCEPVSELPDVGPCSHRRDSEELGLNVDKQVINVVEGENFKPEFLKIVSETFMSSFAC